MNSSNGVYTELRPNCDASNFLIPENDTKFPMRLLTMSSTFDHSFNAPFQFIDQPVKNRMNGRAAFIDDIFHSLSQNDQIIVKQLTAEVTLLMLKSFPAVIRNANMNNVIDYDCTTISICSGVFLDHVNFSTTLQTKNVHNL